MKLNLSRRNFVIVIFLVLFTVLPLSYNACSGAYFSSTQPKTYETVTGNPMTASQASSQVLSAICSVLDRCSPKLNYGTCSKGVLSSSGVSARLGLAAGVDDPFSALENAENSSEIVANGPATANCVSAIKALSCDDPNVINAYIPKATNPFAATYYMVPVASCAPVFSTPVYACSSKIFLRGIANAPLAPSSVTPATTYSVSPALPQGLTLDSASGAISGTPVTTGGPTSYVVTASGLNGVTTTSISIESADGYLVNDLGDGANTGGLVCETASGTCSLRAAVGAANASVTPAVILLPPGVIGLTSNSPLIINKGVEIHGDCQAGTSIDGLGNTQVMQINAGPTVIDHLTLQNGVITDSGGAGIAINATTSSFTSTIKNTTIQNNIILSSTSGFADGAGVAVYGSSPSILATVAITNSVITGNANKAAGGEFGGGIGFYNYAVGSLVGCSITNNTSVSHGAGISVRQSSVNINQTLFSNNSNGAPAAGGGLYLDSGTGAKASVVNSTFAANTSGMGGAVFAGTGTTSNFLNATFVNNHSLSSSYGGAIGGIGPSPTIQNSIFVGNKSAGSAESCGGAGGFSVTSLGSNLADTPAADCGLSAQNDLTSVNAGVGPLQNNGGPSFTVGLLPTSPAIDSANAGVCPLTDQRGTVRLTDGNCDRGAFEVYP